MVGGRLAITRVGFAGPSVRSDVLVTVEDAPALNVQVESTVYAMYGDEIRAQALAILNAIGSPPLQVLLEDSGALPFMIQARLEAALVKHLGGDLPALAGPQREPKRDRLRRSRLYIPGNQPKFMPNAGIYGADCLILDLEDSVPISEKHAARSMVRHALATLDFGVSEVMVRINSGDLGDQDLAAIAACSPEVIVVPKVESPDDLRAVAARLDELESPANIVAILETSLGVQRAYEIATATPRLIAISPGVEDYLADLRATDREATVWAHGAILNACRAAGISPLASVTTEIHEPERIEGYAYKMACYGFDGVGCLHPGQIAPVHRGFAPTEEVLEEARDVVIEFERAIGSGQGAIRVHGRMVDEPVYQRALQTLQRGSTR